MGKISQEMEDTLQRYVSGELSESEKSAMEKLISGSPDLKKRLEEYQAIHTFLSTSIKLEMPSKNFTDKVMGGLDAPPAMPFFSPRSGLFLLAGVLIACGIALSLLSAGAFEGFIPVSTDVIPKTDLLHSLPTLSVPISGKMLVKGILFLNLILAFMLIDRTILRPYFQRRSYNA